jgi:L-ascorbate metabolism protein UlaG (beta-lactamase superfamily)
LVAPPQAKKELQTIKRWKKVKEQVKIVKKEQVKTIKKQKIKISGYYLNHIGARHKNIQNIGYLIEMNGFKVFHAGDTDINENTYQKIGLSQKGVDLAILPNWMLMMDKGIKIVNTYIQPKNIIATHIVPMDKVSVKKEIEKYFPKAILFTTVGEEQGFSK